MKRASPKVGVQSIRNLAVVRPQGLGIAQLHLIMALAPYKITAVLVASED